ncbi:hypothetical protein SUDANB15_01398 [Streptomyces sp. enrichment culture]|uniref:hypothetical protein n=1 Tax=Streptomyces sp. enrichment culture TaxID=1795815 RepID=UPI003F557F2D
MSAAVPLASWKSQIFESAPGFLPDWMQITVLALVVLAVVASWVVKTKRRIAHRRAVRSGQPVHAAARYGRVSGADHLGQYAPQQQGGGADHPGPHAPRRQESGADFLGAHAPRQQRQGDGPV